MRLDGGRLKRMGKSVGDAVLERVGRAASRVQEATPLPADVLESDDAYLVVFDAPGARASDVQVRYRDGAVLVRVDRFRELREGFEMRFPGRGLSLDGRVELPTDAVVDAGAADATLREDGTLAVRLPKREDDESGGDGGETSSGEANDGGTDDDTGDDSDASADEGGGETPGGGDDPE